MSNVDTSASHERFLPCISASTARPRTGSRQRSSEGRWNKLGKNFVTTKVARTTLPIIPSLNHPAEYTVNSRGVTSSSASGRG